MYKCPFCNVHIEKYGTMEELFKHIRSAHGGNSVRRELMDEIYDTLFQMVGTSEFHIGFDPNIITDQCCTAQHGIIEFTLFDGSQWELTIEEQNAPA